MPGARGASDAFIQEQRERALQLLNLPLTATKEDVRRAFKDLVLQWHPDKHGSGSRTPTPVDFAELVAARTHLLDCATWPDARPEMEPQQPTAWHPTDNSPTSVLDACLQQELPWFDIIFVLQEWQMGSGSEAFKTRTRASTSAHMQWQELVEQLTQPHRHQPTGNGFGDIGSTQHSEDAPSNPLGLLFEVVWDIVRPFDACLEAACTGERQRGSGGWCEGSDEDNPAPAPDAGPIIGWSKHHHHDHRQQRQSPIGPRPSVRLLRWCYKWARRAVLLRVLWEIQAALTAERQPHLW